MRILGLSPLQQYIVKRVKLGDSYEQIAENTGESLYSIVYEETLAYSTLNKRWQKPEIEVRKMLSGMLLMVLSLFSAFESSILDDYTVERAYRVSRTSRAGRRKLQDLATIDV